MKTIVTGGAGFIGATLVHSLVGAGHDVVVMDAMTYASSVERLDGVSSDIELIEVRLEDHTPVRAIVDRVRPSVVFHLAAESHVDRSIDSPLGFIQSNVMGTASLLEAIRLAPLHADFRLIHVSTDEVFGSLGSVGKFNESTPYDPRSPYSASKAGSDHLVRAWHHTYGVPTVVTNCSNNYGPYQFPEKLIPVTIARALRGDPILVYGTGRNVRDWIHVQDHCDGLLAASIAGRIGATYLFGGSCERTNLELVSSICTALDELIPREDGESHAIAIQMVDDRPGHDWRYAIDASSTRNELGWSPTIEFEDGVRQTVEWYVTNQAWWRPILERYDGRRLGEGSRS